MNPYRLVRDALGFYSQVPIEDVTEEFAVALATEVEADEGGDDLFDSVIPKRRGRPRKDQ